MDKILETIGLIGLVPVIKIDNPAQAAPLAKALADGGAPCAEITFRTAQAAEAIKNVRKALPDILVGAGTVLTPAQADQAIEAGAQFIVSPGYNPKVVAHCRSRGILIVPGCATPSDMELAIEAGLEAVKFFPAEAAGGLPYLRAVAGPYPGLKFMPTGGINPKNLGSYLSFEKVLACGGSWMVPGDMLAAGNFAGITALTREAILAVQGFEATHVGLNQADEAEGRKTAATFESLFGFPCRELSGSFMAGPGIEVMKRPFLGSHGHLAIATNDVGRAKAYLERLGVALNPETAKTDEKGRLKVIYLAGEIGGLAVHLVRR